MATLGGGFAIWTAVVGSTAVLNVIKGWVQELHEFQRELHRGDQTFNELIRALETSLATLEVWKELWNIKEDVAKDYPRELWGKTNALAIESQLFLIEQLHGEVHRILTAQCGPKSTKTLDFVSNQVPKVLKKLETGKTLMASVVNLSDTAFKNRHQAAMDPANSLEILEEADQNILLQAIHDTRVPSQQFHISFCEWSSPNAKLEVDVYQKYLPPLDMRSMFQLQYNIHLPDQTAIHEFVVEGPLTGEPTPSSSYSSFGEACEQTRMNPARQFFRVSQVGQIGDGYWFTSQTDEDRRERSNAWLQRLMPLKSILYSLTTTLKKNPDQDFPRSERIIFAFKIVEYGFFFCGTNWMANLRLEDVLSGRDREQTRRFYLEAKRNTQTRSMNGHDERRRDAHQFAQDAFLIGTLLIEAGTGSPVRHSINGNGEYVFNMTLKAPPDQADRKTLSEVCTTLQTGIGDGYAQAVSTCIQCRKKWLRNSENESLRPGRLYNKMLREYYSMVYLPLKYLHQARNEEFSKE